MVDAGHTGNVSPRLLVVIVAAVLVSSLLFLGVLVILFLPFLGDPPPDPATAPLEVVANDSDAAVCALNRDDLAAGRHEVMVITEGLPATVEMRDAAGKVVFRRVGDTFPQGTEAEEEHEAVPQPGGPPESVQLSAGEYTVVCRYDGGQSGEARLTVEAE